VDRKLHSNQTRQIKPTNTPTSFGVAVLTIFLPILCYTFAFVCNDVTGCPAPSLLHPRSLTLDALKADINWPGFAGLLNAKAFGWTLAYYASSFVLYALLPAKEVDGVELRTGGRLKYHFNGETYAPSISRTDQLTQHQRSTLQL